VSISCSPSCGAQPSSHGRVRALCARRVLSLVVNLCRTAPPRVPPSPESRPSSRARHICRCRCLLPPRALLLCFGVVFPSRGAEPLYLFCCGEPHAYTHTSSLPRASVAKHTHALTHTHTLTCHHASQRPTQPRRRRPCDARRAGPSWYRRRRAQLGQRRAFFPCRLNPVPP
jgi:hypothetical protein